MILQKEANIPLDRLLGYEERSVTTEPRDDLWAALGRVSPRSARVVAAGVMGLGLLLAVETGVVGALAASMLAAVGLYYVGELQTADPQTTVTTTRREGMSEEQVHRYLTLHDEHESLKSDQKEKAAKKARARAGSTGANPGGSASRSRSRGGR